MRHSLKIKGHASSLWWFRNRGILGYDEPYFQYSSKQRMLSLEVDMKKIKQYEPLGWTEFKGETRKMKLKTRRGYHFGSISLDKRIICHPAHRRPPTKSNDSIIFLSLFEKSRQKSIGRASGLHVTIAALSPGRIPKQHLWKRSKTILFLTSMHNF